MSEVTMDDLRQMARDMSGVNKYGVACANKNGSWADYFPHEGIAQRAINGDTWVIAHNGVVIAQSDTLAPTTHDAAESRELASLAALYVSPIKPDALAGLADESLFYLAKETLTQHRAIQTELSRRRKARKPAKIAACGHPAMDDSGHYCNDADCPRYCPF